MPRITHSVVRQLQVVFSLSTILLLVSLAASYYSIQMLIRNSQLVNHTNAVLLESENIISLMKDAETGQRGYLVTLDPQFLQPYNGSYEKVTNSYGQLRRLMNDNPAQQKNLAEARRLYEAKYKQMRRIIDMTRRMPGYNQDSVRQHAEMLRGKQLMDSLRVVISRIKTEEQTLLRNRSQQQEKYISYTPVLLVIAALISMLITGLTYLRIRRDLADRLLEQQVREDEYRETTRRIIALDELTQAVAGGNYAVRSPDTQDDQLGRIGLALNKMLGSLESTFAELKHRDWLQQGTVQTSNALRGKRDVQQLADSLLATLADYLGAPMATLYRQENEQVYALVGQYASQPAPRHVRVGEGLTGQAIATRNMQVVRDVPADYSAVSSSLGSHRPLSLVLLPLVVGDACVGIIELGFFREVAPRDLEWFGANHEIMAVGLNGALENERVRLLLEETQAQAEELQAQQTELETLNTELEMQAQKLQASEEELRVQQEELQQTNAELEERGLLLEEKNDQIQQKADELELTTRYKSEFLANMSHELRTPLNSILLLSRLLAENSEATLSTDQVEYARVIQSSGNGLLALIDEILDLSKIEAGQMSLHVEDTPVTDITDELRALFTLVAAEKKLQFGITVAPDVPDTLQTDRMRLGQILKNLISNALKFTAGGSVHLTIERNPANLGQLNLTVRDTGIGIAPEKQALVFEAFQQADGSTKRKYGGTGLGLSISRELARLLGGDITLSSQVGQGSAFTVHLPVAGSSVVAAPEPKPVLPVAAAPVSPEPALKSYISPTIPEAVPDDRSTITAQDRAILIVEDDTNFARSLLDYARKKGYKGVVAVRGDEGVRLAETYRPVGILLDIELPIMSGWQVMDALKTNPKTRPIPVHMMSSHRMKKESLMQGAIDFVDKPMAFEQMQDVFAKIEYVLNRQSKKVLIIEDNPRHARALAYFLESFNINSELRSSISDGVTALKREEVDCVILDMGIPDSTAYAVLEEAKKNPGLESLPIIIFTGKSLSMNEELRIKKYADSIVVKTAHSYQRMLDEVSLFLHLVEENQQADAQRSGPKKLGALNQVLTGKTVLVVDDDVRNIFSLSKALEQYNMTVVPALDGKEAMQKLTETPTVDVVLLDMMMPQMDGYDTARAIRSNFAWRDLPVIAVTAKAMAGDREKCLQAGASDYITKPVDIDQLVSLLRVWLYERKGM